jgi:hypothetical protein
MALTLGLAFDVKVERKEIKQKVIGKFRREKKGKGEKFRV